MVNCMDVESLRDAPELASHLADRLSTDMYKCAEDVQSKIRFF